MTNIKGNKKVFSIPKSVLYTGQILELISPKLAVDFALKLFKTPYKFPRPNREQKMYERAEKQKILIPGLNKKIQIYHYGKGNNRNKVLLIHGWAGRGTQLHAMAENFAETGYHAISFDATAHGDSQGKESEMREFMTCVLEIDKQFGPFNFAIGHSLGGMTLINAIHRGFSANKIAIIGSGDSIGEICLFFVEKLGMKPQIGIKLKKKMDKIYGRDIEELSTHNVAKSIKIPVLVIHDKQDEEVPVKCAYSICNNLVNHELLITDGLGHRKILWDKKVIEKINHFFTIN